MNDRTFNRTLRRPEARNRRRSSEFFFEFKIEILVSLVIFSFLMSDVIVQNLTTIEPNILVFYELDDLN